MKKPTRRRWPKPSRKAEIILKERYVINGTGKKDVPIPELLVLANQEGFQYLSRVFAFMAQPSGRVADWIAEADPDDHYHMGRAEAPFSHNLSDDIEFRLGTITSANRKQVLRHYGITQKRRARGSLVKRYEYLISEATSMTSRVLLSKVHQRVG